MTKTRLISGPHRIGRFRVSFEFCRKDLWVGLYWENEDFEELGIFDFYFCFIPCFPLHIRYISPRIYDVRTPEFHRIASKLTGTKWDFSKLEKGDQCCVKDCLFTRSYGYWTCINHRDLELHSFNPIDSYGNLFWSHEGKEVA